MSLPISRGIGALVVNGRGQVLMLFRTKHKYWEFVKGKPQHRESEEETLQRELEEEIGVQFYELIPGFRKEISYTFYVDETQMERRVIFSIVKTDQPIRISGEHTEFRWCSFDEADALVHHDNYHELLAEARKIVNGG